MGVYNADTVSPADLRTFATLTAATAPARRLRLAILGTRGIPACYGGFETFAEELGARLSARGHDVTVYGRSRYVPRQLGHHRGCRLIVRPTVPHKYLDTVVHSAICALDSLGRGYDAAIVCNAANAFVAWMPRVVGTRVVLNVDGLERKRRKWNALGRAWYRMSERLSTWTPNAIVTDARVIETYYRERYGAPSTYIAYGATLDRTDQRETLDQLGLQPGRYILYVSRLEPENNALAVIEGYQQAGLEVPLVIVGDAPYASEYIASLRKAAGPGVHFTGAIYGSGYRQLQSNAAMYVHATEVGGTHPALVEALGVGGVVLSHDESANRETAGDAAEYFDARQPETLARLLSRLWEAPAEREALGRRAAERARRLYSWDAVTDAYEQLCLRPADRRGASGVPAEAGRS